jgi:thioredoxin 2
MTVLTVTEESFESVALRPGIVIIDFWAPWCPPCRGFKPVFEAAAARHTDITFGAVNTDEESDLWDSLGLKSIPTVFAFRDEVLVYAEPGGFSTADFDKFIAEIRALNMDEIAQDVD